MSSLFARALSAAIAWYRRRRRARRLTFGEIAMARQIFGCAIDYRRVHVYGTRYLPFGLQGRNVAMAPNGNIYFHASCFKHDFSIQSNPLRHWFLHEMVHVWQHQLNYPVMRRGAWRIGLNYDYQLASGKRLADYNMEAQGDLLADYFALKYMQDARVMAQSAYAGALGVYEEVLAEFFADRASVANLPRRGWRLPGAAL